jgi:osmotically-inducible protein OsmY
VRVTIRISVADTSTEGNDLIAVHGRFEAENRRKFLRRAIHMRDNGSLCLAHRVQDAINQNPYLSRRELSCEALDGRVVLRGRVRSFFQKQMAQESVRYLEGIVSIENYLEVE